VALLFTVAIGGGMSTQTGAEVRCCAVVELRQYTLKPQQRDVLIQLFDEHFVESQEAVGVTVIGQFRDRGNADRFVWLRGFRDMDSRRESLAAFYDGPVWAAHRTEANNTMIDSDDVLLLKPARPDLAIRLVQESAVGTAAHDRGPATVLAGIYEMPRAVDGELISQFDQDVVPKLRSDNVRLEGVFVTEAAKNTFARLPVREGEHVLVWFGLVEHSEVTTQWLDRVAQTSAFANVRPSILDLAPTSRSMLGGGPLAARATNHDFDFIFGSWKVHNRYLKERLSRSTEWIEFEAHSEVSPLLDGFGHLDRYSAIRDGSAFEGVTVRLFDPATAQWSIHWADTKHARNFLPPMTGRFLGGVGEFYGEETVRGRTVLCRFLWTRPEVDEARWEQAFSEDGGKTWETNWIMTFTRR
jgi:hypothetical protein